jgi:hypothetical protein
VVQAAPDRQLTIVQNPRGNIYSGFNGSRGWYKDAGGQSELTGTDLADARRDADFHQYLKLRRTYPEMAVAGRQRLGDRYAYVVDATSRYGSREKLYFDVGTGLLVRRYVPYRTAFGIIPEIIDFADYRKVGGVMLPFTIRWARPPYTATQSFTTVRTNVPVDAARFDHP